ncbi:MAG: lipoate--protein ligase [Bacteroidales bacterium]|nr:lipoate--protein ligase [Bacteroidales bacterium]
MRCLMDSTVDPYWNLAVEEYLLTASREPVFRLWRNAPAIIVGRNQNTHAEINSQFVRENNIAVVRRLSGGGAVFHDLGNVNYTFTDTFPAGSDTAAVFARFTRPILDVLQGLGVAARLEGRNDLVIDGRKFSGNAIALHKGRILMHGTLLFSASMKDLASALKPKIRDKGRGVPSNPRAVCNLSEYLPRGMTIPEFLDLLKKHVTGNTDAPWREQALTAEECLVIGSLCDTRYRTDAWNYGSLPMQGIIRSSRFPGGNMEVRMNLTPANVIDSVKIYGDYFFLAPTSDIEEALKGCPRDRESISRCLEQFALEDYFRNMPPSALTDLLL